MSSSYFCDVQRKPYCASKQLFLCKWLPIHWNSSVIDTVGSQNFVCYSEVSLTWVSSVKGMSDSPFQWSSPPTHGNSNYREVWKGYLVQLGEIMQLCRQPPCLSALSLNFVVSTALYLCFYWLSAILLLFRLPNSIGGTQALPGAPLPGAGLAMPLIL